jgi:hypothetical protein
VKLWAFVPRTRSAFVFTIIMACYGRMAESLLSGIVYIFHFGSSSGYLESHRRSVAGAFAAVFFAPIIESSILIAAIELLRWMKAPGWLQVFLAAAILAGPHSFQWGPLAFVVMPGFTIQAASYLYWRSISWKKAFAVVACIHALLNLSPAMRDIGNATRGPNQTMQPTAGPRIASFHFMKTLPLQATLAPASGG